MKKIFLIVLVVLALGWSPLWGGAVEFIDKDELKGMLDSPGVIIIDTRIPQDWDSSETKIKGAVRLPPEEIESAVRNYPKDQTLVFYCS